MNILNARVHGVIDYIAGAVLILAPGFFDFSPTPSAISYTFGVIQLGMSLLTRYPLGLVKMIPFPTHGNVEIVEAIVLFIMPWIAGFGAEDVARNFFVIAGLALLAVWTMTNYRREMVATDTTLTNDSDIFRRSA